MKMSVGDQSSYPILTNFIRIQLPQAINSKKVITNLWKYGRLTVGQVQYALMWDTAPNILIRPLDNNFCGVAKAFGCFDANDSGVIMLDEKMVQTFEANPGDPNARFFSANGASLPIVGGTILHELCHWGNFRAGRNETREMGQAFELATYGAIIGTPSFSSFEDEGSIMSDN